MDSAKWCLILFMSCELVIGVGWLATCSRGQGPPGKLAQDTKPAPYDLLFRILTHLERVGRGIDEEPAALVPTR